MIQEFISEIKSLGFEPHDFNPDGMIKRFKRKPTDKHKDAWCRIFENHGVDGEKFYFFFGGDWREPGVEYKVCSKGKISAKEKKIINEKINETKKQIEAEESALREKCIKESLEIWNESQEFSETEYTKKKKINGNLGVRVKNTINGKVLIVPVRDIEGKMVGLQKIYPDGKKLFHPGTKKKGSFHLIGDHINGKTHICEGFATGASINMATREPVIVAFDAGNLEPVSKTVRKNFPDTEIIICGDDDRCTKDNPGRKMAQRAAKETSAKVVFPDFGPKADDKSLTDFNDLHVAVGLDKVKECIDMRNEVEEVVEATEVQKPKKPSEMSVVNRLIDQFEDNILKWEDDLFLYQNGFWKHLAKSDIDIIKTSAFKSFGPSAMNWEAESAFRTFKLMIPSAPHNMFSPNPYCSNFLDGTLHILEKNGRWEKKFLPHSKTDYLINQLPYEYTAKRETNVEFENMLIRAFSNDNDKMEKIRSIAQMFAACLFPAFPRLFLFHGETGSGKSTVIMVAMNFLKNENISRVQPSMFHGFNMSSMAGKLANIVLDINTHRPMEDDIIKQIEDRQPVFINRKGKSAIYAPLPALHIFGANDIPPTLEGGSRAHGRRWTFVEFKSFRASGQYDKNYAFNTFNQGPLGVLSFAEEGLDDLLSSGGHFTNPSSGTTRLEEWMASADPIAVFIDAVNSDEVFLEGSPQKLKIKNDEMMQRALLYKSYKNWFQEMNGNHDRLFSSIKFFKELERKGFFGKRYDHGRYILGFSNS